MDLFAFVVLLIGVGALTAPPSTPSTSPPSPPPPPSAPSTSLPSPPPPPSATSSPPSPLAGGVDVSSLKGETIGPFGSSTGGDPFDDGRFDGVRSVTIYMDSNLGVTGLRIQYVNGEKFHIRDHGSAGDQKVDFTLQYPEEFITAIHGTESFDTTYQTSYVSSISFDTSYGRSSESFGTSTIYSTSFVLESEGGLKKCLVGFLGSSSERINTLGGRFQPQSSSVEGKPNSVSEVVPPIGGVSGLTFDDGRFDGVSMLIGRSFNNSIAFLKVQYVQGTKFETRDHGSYSEAQTESMVELEYPEEHIIFMNISWTLTSLDPQVATPKVVAMEIATSYSRYFVLGTFDSNAKSYILKPKRGLGPKVVGLMGTSHDVLNNLGARFATSSSPKTTAYALIYYVIVVIVLGGM